MRVSGSRTIEMDRDYSSRSSSSERGSSKFDGGAEAAITNGYGTDWFSRASDRDSERENSNAVPRISATPRVIQMNSPQADRGTQGSQAQHTAVETGFGRQSRLGQAAVSAQGAIGNRSNALSGGQSLTGGNSSSTKGNLAATDKKKTSVYASLDVYDAQGQHQGFSLDKKLHDENLRFKAYQDHYDDMERGVFGNMAGRITAEQFSSTIGRAAMRANPIVGGAVALGSMVLASKAGDIANSFVGSKRREGLNEADQARYDAHRKNINELIKQEKSGWAYTLGDLAAGAVDIITMPVNPLGAASAFKDVAQDSHAFKKILQADSSPQLQQLYQEITQKEQKAREEREEHEKIHGRNNDSSDNYGTQGILATIAATPPTQPAQPLPPQQGYGIPELGDLWGDITFEEYNPLKPNRSKR